MPYTKWQKICEWKGKAIHQANLHQSKYRERERERNCAKKTSSSGVMHSENRWGWEQRWSNSKAQLEEWSLRNPHSSGCKYGKNLSEGLKPEAKQEWNQVKHRMTHFDGTSGRFQLPFWQSSLPSGGHNLWRSNDGKRKPNEIGLELASSSSTVDVSVNGIDCQSSCRKWEIPTSIFVNPVCQVVDTATKSKKMVEKNLMTKNLIPQKANN